MKRILVCGGAGFIGSNIIKKLWPEGNDIICLDNLSTGMLRNIEEFVGKPRFKFINQDIIDPIKLEIDQIYNFACPASPPAYQKDPLHTFRTSVWGIWNLLDLAYKNSAILLQASTSEIYGDPERHPQNEDYWGNVNPIGIRSCYDEGKRAAETLMMDYHRQYGVKIKIARIFNTYGPNMDPQDGRVISNFINQALKGLDLTIYGDGSQTRSFCFIDDLVEGIIPLMNSSSDIIGPINIGNTEEYTISELTTIIKDLLPTCSGISHKKLPQDDPKQRKPDITLAKTLLGWKPSTNIKIGIKKTINYYKKIAEL